MNTRSLRILVVKNRAMGDAILTLAAIQFFKEAIPNIHITYLVPSWIFPLFKNTKTSADSVIPLDLNSFNGALNTYSSILGKHFDFIFEFNQSGKGRKFFTLVSLFRNIPYYFHNHHKKNKLNEISFVISQGQILPNTQRDLDLCYSFMTKVKNYEICYPNYRDFTPKLKLKNFNIEKKSKKVLFGVVASRKTKMYPNLFWPKLANLLKAKGVEEIIIPLSNSYLDKEIENELNSEIWNIPYKIIKTSLDQLPQIVNEASFYIGNDTGIKHLAVALGKRSLTFFGPEDPKEWHPYNKEIHPVLFVENLECRTLTSHFCGLSECSSMVCLNTFTPEKVLEKLINSRFFNE